MSIKAQQLFNSLVEALSTKSKALPTICYGGGYELEVFFDPTGSVCLHWDEGDGFVGYSPNYLTLDVAQFESALPKAEADTPFSNTPEYINGVLQVLAFGDWCWDAPKYNP